VNFASRILNDPDKIGVRDIIDRIKMLSPDGQFITSDDLVDRCLDVLGPLDVLETTRNGLKKYASKYSELSWADSYCSSNFDKSAIAIIQLIVSSQEYQTV
jgi:hypothetical protein